MSEDGFLEQLKQRRVIRAALLYVALAWVALQAADLLAGAGIISEQLVRALILVAVVGFPIIVVASWFLDSPWRDKKSLAVAGDLVIIVAITAAAGLFAWQQWFASFVRPSIAIHGIEATDTRDDTLEIAGRLARDLRTLLAMRPEIRVLELGESSPDLDFRVSGTMAQGGSSVRLTIQLLDGERSLVWGETFEDNPDDEVQLLNRVQSELYGRLPLPADAFDAARDLVAACESLAERDLLVTQARIKFEEIDELPPPQRPVAQQLAMQHLADADALCPGWPDTRLLRMMNTLELDQDDIDEDGLLREFPNSAFIYRKIGERRKAAGKPEEAAALFDEACFLQPSSGLPECN